MTDYHPFKSFIPEKATKLIIGSIPPHRFCKTDSDDYCLNTKLNENDVNFYYGSCDNSFWHLIGDICNVNFSFKNSYAAVEQRQKFLESKNIGITDIISSCERKNNNSSSDKDLAFIKPRKDEILQILEDNSGIEKLIYTSNFIKKLMYDTFRIDHKHNKDCKYMKEIFLNRKYNVYILYSPSPQALRGLGINGEKLRYDQYKKIFS